MSQPCRPEFPDPSLQIRQTLFDAPAIADRVAELAGEISRDYAGKDPVVACVLQGAVPLTRDLTRELTVPFCSDSIRISRYRQDGESSAVCLIRDLTRDVTGRHVLLVDDIVDTGLSLNYLAQVLLERNPASLGICTLLDRPGLRLVNVPINYTGFRVDEEFIVGYGLDYKDRFRDLPFLGVLDLQPEGFTMDGDRFSLKMASPQDSIGLVPRSGPASNPKPGRSG